MAIDWESLINRLALPEDPGTADEPLRAADVEAPIPDPEQGQGPTWHWLYGWIVDSSSDAWQC